MFRCCPLLTAAFPENGAQMGPRPFARGPRRVGPVVIQVSIEVEPRSPRSWSPSGGPDLGDGARPVTVEL